MSFKTKIDRSLNEKDVENAYRSEFLKEKDIKITSPYKVDGLMENKNIRSLLEFKYDEALKNKISQCNVLIQCLYYLKKFEINGDKLPTTIFVGDLNECFAIHTNAIVKYLSSEIDWKMPASEAHKRNPDLIQAMVGDTNILPFIFNIDENFHIRMVIDKIKDFSDNVVRKVRITKHNIVSIFDYFDKNVLGNINLTTNEKANLFVQIIINPGENFLHPKRKNLLITKSFGELKINRNLYNSFFQHFEGDVYSPKEKEGLTELVDRLIEDTTRRNKGEFFTPTPFVDLAHKYISDTFGEDWKERFAVWDCAWGTGNLTRDYKFKELYASTLEQSDIDTANQMGYNPEATKFQHDFLNDGAEKLPVKLREAIKSGREILFLINPPYATGANFGESDKKDSGKTLINSMMLNDKWGACSQNLYAQFMYRIFKCQEVNKNVKIGIFCPPLFLTGGSYTTFRSMFFEQFRFEKGFLFEACHFSDVAKNWGISFAIFGDNNVPMNGCFKMDVIDTNKKDFTLSKIKEKTIYNADYNISASNWVRQDTKGVKTIKSISLKNSIVAYVGKNNRGSVIKGHLGYLFIVSNNVDKNAQNVGIWSTSFYNGNGLSVIQQNFARCTALFTARKLIRKDWINAKDEYISPNENHPDYEQLTYDSIVYSLFNNRSQQSSLRQVEYKDKLFDIKNEFFWLSKDEIQNLANDNSYDELYKDAKNGEERFVYKKLFVDGIYDKLSPDAKKVLDMSSDLLRRSISMRKIMSESYSEYHLNSFDAGYAQLKRVWKEYFKDDFKAFRDTYTSLEDRMRPLVYELGFLRK